MKIASAIVTDEGSRVCHAAIVSRELGILCIVGTKNSTQVISKGKGITVDCSKGEGYVFEGNKFLSKIDRQFKEIPRTKTKVCFKYWFS